MKKEELAGNINRTPDKNGIIDVGGDRHGGTFTTDSIRLDMDGGRLIVCQQDSPCYETNKTNWKQELEFAKKL